MCWKQTPQSEQKHAAIDTARFKKHHTMYFHTRQSHIKVSLFSSLLYPYSIVQSFEAIVSTFAQQLARDDTFVFMTETILFVAELVSLNCMVTIQ